jgi:hypothetical protein
MLFQSYNLRFAGMLFRILSPRALRLPENLNSFLTDEIEEDRPDWIVEVSFGTDHVEYGERDFVKCFPWKDGECFWRIVPADGDRTCRLIVPDGIADQFVLNANWTLFLMIDRMLLPFDRLILHASAVIHEGQAILFTAPSGTGKSTQASLWEDCVGAEIINGDKVILSAGDVPIAYGGPIAGTSRIFKDVWAPVRAIVYLHQGSENTLTFLDRRHAFMALYSQAVKSSDDAAFNEALIPLIEKIVEKTPVVDYYCQPNASAVSYLQSKLSNFPTDSDCEEFLCVSDLPNEH